MPASSGAENERRRTQLAGIIAAVLGVHLAIGWLLLATTRVLSLRIEPHSLEIVFIAPPAVRTESSPSPPNPLSPPIPPSSLTHNPASRWQKRSAAAGSPSRPEAPPAATQGNAIHPPDWAEELTRAARAGAAPNSTPEPKDFGFPRAPPPPAKAEEFGWSHAQTQRIESLPGGGLLLNLNDNCVLVFNPLPFAMCLPGKKAANGDLFKHMHDPARPGDWKDAR